MLLVLALGCGAGGLDRHQPDHGRRNGSRRDEGETQPVFVAMADIGANEELTAQNIKLEEWPKNTSAGSVDRLEEVEGKRSRMRTVCRRADLASKLRRRGRRGRRGQGHSARLPRGRTSRWTRRPGRAT